MGEWKVSDRVITVSIKSSKRMFGFGTVQPLLKPLRVLALSLLRKLYTLTPLGINVWSFVQNLWFCLTKLQIEIRSISNPFSVKGGDPAALSSTATLLRLHPPH